MAVLSQRAPERELARDEIQQLIAEGASALSVTSPKTRVLQASSKE